MKKHYHLVTDHKAVIQFDTPFRTKQLMWKKWTQVTEACKPELKFKTCYNPYCMDEKRRYLR